MEGLFLNYKLQKNYSRSTMHQQRPSFLAVLSIEHEIVDSSDTRKLIEDFAHLKARRVFFL